MALSADWQLLEKEREKETESVVPKRERVCFEQQSFSRNAFDCLFSS